MTVGELVQKENFEVLSEGDFSAEIKGCYCSDLLSHCMANIDTGNVWITVQTNINIVAIATLTEPSCIIIAQGMEMSGDVLDKAKDENVTILRSKLAAYELCVMLGKMI